MDCVSRTTLLFLAHGANCWAGYRSNIDSQVSASRDHKPRTGTASSPPW